MQNIGKHNMGREKMHCIPFGRSKRKFNIQGKLKGNLESISAQSGGTVTGEIKRLVKSEQAKPMI